MFLLPIAAKAEIGQNRLTVCFYYRSGQTAVDSSYRNNYSSLYLLSGLKNVSKIEIASYASPDGSATQNDSLCQLRSHRLDSLLRLEYPDARILTKYMGADWDGLLIELIDSENPYYSAAADLAKNTPLVIRDANGRLVSTRQKTLMDFRGGTVWKRMSADIFPDLCRSEVTVFFRPVNASETIQKEASTVPQYHQEYPTRTEQSQQEPPKEIQQPIQAEDPVQETAVAAIPVSAETDFPELSEPAKKVSCVCLKNNLLYSAALVANLGVEFRLCNKLSLDLPFSFSPYDITETFKIRTLSAQPSLRFWTNETYRGFFISAYGHVGFFNVALGGKTRYQSPEVWNNPSYGGGVGAGWRLMFGRSSNWGVEFELGGGYCHIPYSAYHNVSNGALKGTSIKNYWGPTKAGINILYSISR